jgi:hypothetical protein
VALEVDLEHRDRDPEAFPDGIYEAELLPIRVLGASQADEDVVGTEPPTASSNAVSGVSSSMRPSAGTSIASICHGVEALVGGMPRPIRVRDVLATAGRR